MPVMPITSQLRPLHRQIGAAAMHGDARVLRRPFAGVREARAGRVRHAHMRHTAGAEKGFLAREGAVDVLIDKDEIARRKLLAERPAGRDADHVRDAQPFQRVDIGAVGNRGGAMDMAAPVTGQKGHGHAAQGAGQDRIRGRAPWRLDGLPAGLFQPVDLVEPRSADHPDHGLRHCLASACIARGIRSFAAKENARSGP
jgi:hypothetical protein